MRHKLAHVVIGLQKEHDAMVTGSADDALGLRPVIERSWRRSTACGVPSGTELTLPYDENIDGDSRLIRAAQPVIERLVDTMADAPHSLLLADPDARIIHRWVGMRSLNGRLDNASIAPGFGFTEEYAGTNGVGTALEEARVVTVRGTEHFAERLRAFSCVGVPIRNPVRGNVEGILDFSCMAKDFNPLMTSLLVEVAKHIETRFAQQSSVSESELLECFLRSSRSHRGPVVGMRPNMFLTNTAAAEQIGAADQAILWDVAVGHSRRGSSEGVIDLSCGRYSFRSVLVHDHLGADGGVVVRLQLDNTRVAPHGGRPSSSHWPATARRGALAARPAGRSPQWRKLRDRMQMLAAVAEPVAFTGEDGSGKFWAAERFAALRGGEVRVFDGAGEHGEAHFSLADACRSALRDGDAVIVRRIDRLPVAVRTELSALIRGGSEPALPLIVTCTDDPRDTVVRALAGFSHQLWLPPLAQRLDDIVDIVPALLAELAPDRVVTCALPVQQVLMRYSWPGNVAELRDVLAAALGESKGNQVEVADLPAWLMKRAHRRQLTPIEQTERDLIIDTLGSVGNNRAEAARVLGIGRATLYRKLRALGIANGYELTV